MLNPYFNNLNHTGQQDLIESLIIETIAMHGIEVYYMRRTLGQHDELLNEDDLPIFNSAVPVEMYLKTVDNFEGDGDIFSKFGFEMRDSMNLSVAKKRFHEEIGEDRPFEGDLLYFPLNKKIFEIMHSEHEELFYQMGSLQTYGLRAELLEYSNQRFDTGIPEIDTRFEGVEPTGGPIEEYDDWADNEFIQTESDEILDFDEADPFSEGGRF